MAIKPLADRVVVRRVTEERRKSLIEIPDSAREKPQDIATETLMEVLRARGVERNRWLVAR